MTFQWNKNASFYHVSAEQAHSTFEAIRQRDGKLTPAAVVDEARPEDSVLHPDFEWDDAEAAEKYRRHQARQMIAAVCIVQEETKQPVRAFVNVQAAEEPQKGAGRQYLPLPVVLETPPLRSQMLADALKEAQVFQQKYQTLSALKPVFAAIELVAANTAEQEG